jgi:cytochrome c biogenesis protein ResB
MEEPRVITAERPDAPKRRKRKIFLRVAFEWAFRELMRIRLAVWLLIIMGVTMVVGSIFPQGYEADTYISSWGETRYHIFSRLGLLNLFHTKYFKLLGTILLLNIIVCSIVRLSARRGVSLSKTTAPADARPIAMGGEADSAISRAVRSLTERGYFVARAAGGMLSARRGPWPEGISLLYHLAMAIAIIGFFVSALHSYEGDVTLYPGEPTVVKTGSLDTGWNRMRYGVAAWNFMGWHPFDSARPDTMEWDAKRVTLTLNEFFTEWELYQDKYYPKDWLSDVAVEVKGHGPQVYWPSRLIEVNRPLRAGGLTFYQMAYEQEFDAVVWKDGTEVERVHANAYVPFTLESIEGTFFPGTMRVGTLYEKYKPTTPVVPHVPLKWQPPAPPEEAAGAESSEGEPGAGGAEEDHDAGRTAGEQTAEGQPAEAESTGMTMAEADTAAPVPPPPPERVDLGNLSAEEPIEVEGYQLTLENPYEGSVLSYRHDPGVTLLYIAITLFIFGLAIRTYWPSYRVSLWIEEKHGGAVGKLIFRATGMLGEPKVVEDGLVDELGGEWKEPGLKLGTAVEPSARRVGPSGEAPEASQSAGTETPTTGAPHSEVPKETPERRPGEGWKRGTYPLRDALPEDDSATDKDEPGTDGERKPGKYPLRDALPSDEDEPKPGTDEPSSDPDESTPSQ